MKRIILALVAAVAILAMTVAPAFAQVPALPHAFYGTVTVDDLPAPIGTIIEARGTGVLVGTEAAPVEGNPLPTTEVGKYGGPGLSIAKLVVQGNIADGTIINFYVNTVRADQTAQWHSGQVSVLNLTAASPPRVTTTGSESVGNTSATLKGNLASLGKAAQVGVFFEYGTTTTYGASTARVQTSTLGAFSAGITGLTPGTVYHFRAMVDGGAQFGNSFGADMTFTTPTGGGGGGPVAPAISSSSPVNVTTTSATLVGNLTNMGTAPSVQVSFDWGIDAGLTGGNIAGVPGTLLAPAQFTAGLTGLAPNTTYFFRANANGGAAGTTFGTVLSFTTLPAGGGGTGGGGSGGGTTVPITGATGSGPLTIGTSGKTLTAVTIKGPGSDDRCRLYIVAGTTLRMASGETVTSLSMKLASPVPAAPQGKTVVYAVDLEPNGTTFDPGATLEMEFYAEDMPKGGSVSDLELATWDGSRWLILETQRDPAAGTLSTKIGHFTVFGIMSGIPQGGQPITTAPPSAPTSPPASQTTQPPSIQTTRPTTPPPSQGQVIPPPAGTNWVLVTGVIAAVAVVAGLAGFFVKRRTTH